MLKAPATADESAVQPRKNLDLPNKLSCRAQSDYSTLNGLPKSVVMSDINSATPILVHTSHSVISGPYHRNGNAILAVADFFETDVTKARKVASDWHVDLVAYCDVKRFDQSKNNSGRLDYRIARNDLPDWLELISSHDETLKVLKVKK